MSTQIENDVLRALRRITRSIALHSRQLASTFGLTGPQLVCLRAIGELGETSPSVLAKEVSLSQGTITGIIDRLIARQLVSRQRSVRDRRVVAVCLTEAGTRLVEEAPSPLQARFVKRLETVSAREQKQIRDTLELVVEMMDSEDVEAAPVLSASPAAQSSEEVAEDLAAAGDLAVVADLSSGFEDPGEP